MKTVALRFADQFAPKEGTIAAHESIIKKNGFVWYGKMGSVVSDKVITDIRENEEPKILLIHSGHMDRYWAYIEDIKKEKPSFEEFPEYYHATSDNFKTWFKITRFEKAPQNVLSKCFVTSSGAVLTTASKYSMSPYFIINYEG